MTCLECQLRPVTRTPINLCRPCATAYFTGMVQQAVWELGLQRINEAQPGVPTLADVRAMQRAVKDLHREHRRHEGQRRVVAFTQRMAS